MFLSFWSYIATSATVQVLLTTITNLLIILLAFAVLWLLIYLIGLFANSNWLRVIGSVLMGITAILFAVQAGYYAPTDTIFVNGYSGFISFMFLLAKLAWIYFVALILPGVTGLMSISLHEDVGHVLAGTTYFVYSLIYPFSALYGLIVY